jgi:pantoate--beta-alanine ligase
MSLPQVLNTIDQARAAVRAAHARGETLGFVPTMGALHEGHLSLVRRAKAEHPRAIASIFVNPTQFAPHEDFSRYPRTFDADLALLADANCDYVFAPAPEEVYPPGFSTYVQPPAVALPLEGQFRPDHFRGVATVVLKLFEMAPADAAYFGQKDYQQAAVIRAMVRDLNLPIRIEVCPIVREADGLALSSRNRYLSPDERQRAPAIHRALQTAAALLAQGERRGAALRAAMQQILQQAGFQRIDYALVADRDTLAELELVDRPAVALIAAHLGATRLIDNLLLEV